MERLEQLRAELSRLDVELLERVARRQQIVAEIGRVKSAAGRGTRDYAREKEVLGLARRTAERVGVDPRLGEALFRLLIRASLATQERQKLVSSGAGSGKRALVIGGAGRMGRWFLAFLDSQGYQVEVCDPAGAVDGHRWHATLDQTPLEQELIVVAAPIEQTAEILHQLARRRPSGVVFDIGSIKEPLSDGLRALVAAGCRVTSIHPLFGPDTELLSGRNLVLVDVGVAAATASVRELFASTMAELVEMSLTDHDRVMAYVLGLSHLVNIAFFGALAEAGEQADELARLSSATFDAQLEIAGRLADENPYLYFEIQTLNPHSPRALIALLNATTQLAGRVLDGDQRGFIELMEQGKRLFASRPTDRP